MASVRKPLSFGNNAYGITLRRLIVLEEEGTANSVPAAAVIQSPKRCSDSLGVKGA